MFITVRSSFFTSHPEEIENIIHLAPLGCSNHNLLALVITGQSHRGIQTYFQQLDWSELFYEVEHNWY